jgi:hypothetical protein
LLFPCVCVFVCLLFLCFLSVLVLLHNCFCTVFYQLPLSTLVHWHNFYQCARSLSCFHVSLDHHSVPFSHL